MAQLSVFVFTALEELASWACGTHVHILSGLFSSLIFTLTSKCVQISLHLPKAECATLPRPVPNSWTPVISLHTSSRGPVFLTN